MWDVKDEARRTHGQVIHHLRLMTSFLDNGRLLLVWYKIYSISIM